MKIFFVLLSMCWLGLAFAGDKEGHGGDPLAAEFITRGYFVLAKLRAMPSDHSILNAGELDRFAQLLKITRVEITEGSLHDAFDAEVTGLVTADPKIPGQQRIQVNRAGWRDGVRIGANLNRFVFHEYLWVLGKNDANYRIANELKASEDEFRAFERENQSPADVEFLRREIVKRGYFAWKKLRQNPIAISAEQQTAMEVALRTAQARIGLTDSGPTLLVTRDCPDTTAPCFVVNTERWGKAILAQDDLVADVFQTFLVWVGMDRTLVKTVFGQEMAYREWSRTRTLPTEARTQFDVVTTYWQRAQTPAAESLLNGGVDAMYSGRCYNPHTADIDSGWLSAVRASDGIKVFVTNAVQDASSDIADDTGDYVPGHLAELEQSFMKDMQPTVVSANGLQTDTLGETQVRNETKQAGAYYISRWITLVDQGKYHAGEVFLICYFNWKIPVRQQPDTLPPWRNGLREKNITPQDARPYWFQMNNAPYFGPLPGPGFLGELPVPGQIYDLLSHLALY